MISTVSPTSYPWSSAVPASMTTSFAAAGHRPSRTFSGLNCASAGAVSMPNPKVGAPSELTASPSRQDLRVALVEHRSGRERDPVDATHRLEQRRVDGRARRRSPSIEMSSPFP